MDDVEEKEMVKSMIRSNVYIPIESEQPNPRKEPDHLKTSLKRLTNMIIDNAKHQSQWNKKIPAKWFPLERDIMKAKEGPNGKKCCNRVT